MTAARRETVQDELLVQRFPMSAEEAARRINSQLSARTTCNRLPSGEVHCGGCLRGRCFQLIEEQGLTRVTTTEDLSEVDMTSLWQPLDAQSLTTLQDQLDERVQDKLIDQELRFEPRWGVTGGVLAGVTIETTPLGALGLGGRIGVRRWFDVHLLGHAALEYRFKGDHELSLRVGLEVARWTEGRLWGLAGAPPASVALFIGPMVRVPDFRAGLRTGVGFHVTDLRSVPFFIEFAAETRFTGESSRVVGTFTVGVGI